MLRAMMVFKIIRVVTRFMRKVVRRRRSGPTGRSMNTFSDIQAALSRNETAVST